MQRNQCWELQKSMLNITLKILTIAGLCLPLVLVLGIALEADCYEHYVPCQPTYTITDQRVNYNNSVSIFPFATDKLCSLEPILSYREESICYTKEFEKFSVSYQARNEYYIQVDKFGNSETKLKTFYDPKFDPLPFEVDELKHFKTCEDDYIGKCYVKTSPTTLQFYQMKSHFISEVNVVLADSSPFSFTIQDSTSFRHDLVNQRISEMTCFIGDESWICFNPLFWVKPSNSNHVQVGKPFYLKKFMAMIFSYIVLVMCILYPFTILGYAAAHSN
jgi:hypothetical protein